MASSAAGHKQTAKGKNEKNHMQEQQKRDDGLRKER